MEKLNIAELLKDCPKGMELDCVMYDNVTFEGIKDVGYINILIKTPNGVMKLSKSGCYHVHPNAKCVIFPKGKTTWEGFQRPFKDGDVVASDSGEWLGIIKNKYDTEYYTIHCALDGTFHYKFLTKGEYYFSRLATEEEKQKLFDAIRENGYKWNPETKTLEKLIEPKFKVGDRIKSKNRYTNYLNDNHIFTITEIKDGRYWSNLLAIEYIEKQDDWELVPNKFDITTLKPFESRVLVRTDNRKWVAAFYSHYDKDSLLHHCVVGGLWYEQCVPYNGNEHLLGTTNDCDEYFKTWE